jgi:hypothetical protein
MTGWMSHVLRVPRDSFRYILWVLRKLLLTVDTTDDNFMPKRVVVYGGEGDNLKKLSDVNIDE